MEPLGAPGKARLTSLQNSAPRGRLVEGGVREALGGMAGRELAADPTGMSICWY